MPLTITLTRRTAAVGLAAAVALGGAFALGAATGGDGGSPAYAATPGPAQPSAEFPGITVTGLGRVTGVPNVLTVQLGASLTRDDVSGALSAASSALGRVRAALTGGGVATADLETSDVSVQPDYSYDGGRQTIDGYRATESLTAKLRDLGKAGDLITAAASAGGDATTVSGVSFDLADDTELLNTARDAAFADARAKARRYARDAGRRLGPLVRISETVTGGTEPVPVAGAAKSAPVAVPIDPGTTQLSVTVDVVYGLG
jgi:uncharacterized protein YggE